MTKKQVEADEERWKLIEEALVTPDLRTEGARLGAIGAVVGSRKPLTPEDIAWALEIAKKLKWAKE